MGENAGHNFAGEVLEGGSGQALAGHGVMDGSRVLYNADPQFVSPAGTTVVAPRPGTKIADSTGQILENVNSVEHLEDVLRSGIAPSGNRLTPRNYEDLRDYQVYSPGESGPNYDLLRPNYDDQPLNIYRNSTTTDVTRPLSDFLEPDQVCVFWAACTQGVPYLPE